jgi:hypothetical protein
LCDIRYRLLPGDVTDEDVDTTKFAHSVGNKPVAEVFIAQVASQQYRLAA